MVEIQVEFMAAEAMVKATVKADMVAAEVMAVATAEGTEGDMAVDIMKSHRPLISSNFTPILTSLKASRFSLTKSALKSTLSASTTR